VSSVAATEAVEVVREDVSLEVPAGTLTATVVAAPTRTGGRPGALIVCVPGMTYRRAYYDARIPGHAGYSFAERAALHGHVVVCLDNLGTGESGPALGPGEVGLDELGSAAAQAADLVRSRLAAGDLLDRLPAQALASVIGVGHSMGGGVITAAQARHSGFTAVAALGFTTQALAGIYEPAPNEEELTFAERRDWARAHIPAKLWGRAWDELDPYFEIERAGFADLFYAADVPADVVAYDTEAATVSPRQAALDIITPGLAARYTAAITTPMFLAFGSVDLSPDPRREVESYAQSRDITLFLLEGSAHCHNLASSRALLWERMLAWIEALQ
jgi:pimeloyl-ACP methyl ester carboxylesterase